MGKKKTQNRPMVSVSQSRPVKAKAKSKPPKVPKPKRKRHGGFCRFIFVTLPSYLFIAAGAAIGFVLLVESNVTDTFDAVQDFLDVSDYLLLDYDVKHLAGLPVIALGSLWLGAMTFSNDWRRKKKGTFDVRPGDLDYYWVKKLKARILLVLTAIIIGILVAMSGTISSCLLGEEVPEANIFFFIGIFRLLFSHVWLWLGYSVSVGMTTMLIGQYCSLRMKRVVFALPATVFLVLPPLAWWTYAGYIGEVPFYWTLLPLWIALLASTRTRMRARFHDNSVTYRARRKAKMQRRAVWLSAFVVTCVACPIHRVRQIPIIDYGYEECDEDLLVDLAYYQNTNETVTIGDYTVPKGQTGRYFSCLVQLAPEELIQYCDSLEDNAHLYPDPKDWRQVAEEAVAEGGDPTEPDLQERQLKLLENLCVLINERELSMKNDRICDINGISNYEERESEFFINLREWADTEDQHSVLLAEAIQYLQEWKVPLKSRLWALAVHHFHDRNMVHYGLHPELDFPLEGEAKVTPQETLSQWNRLRLYYLLQPWERIRTERAIDSTYQQLAQMFSEVERTVQQGGEDNLWLYKDGTRPLDLCNCSQWDLLSTSEAFDLLYLPSDAKSHQRVIREMHQNELERRATLIYLALRWHYLEYECLPDSLYELSGLTQLSSLSENREWACYSFPSTIPTRVGGAAPFYYISKDESAKIPPRALESFESTEEDRNHDSIMPYLWYDLSSLSGFTPHGHPELRDHRNFGVYIDLNFVREASEETEPTTGESPSDREDDEPVDEDPLEVLESSEVESEGNAEDGNPEEIAD